jgi:hypothetical protein
MACVADVDLCTLVGKYQILKESAVSSFYPEDIGCRFLKIKLLNYMALHQRRQ